MPSLATLPVSNASACEPAQADTSRTLRILVVDDCPDTRASMRLLLQLWGHEVYEAPDGPAALRLARSLVPDVILLDIAMPGMDGCEVARHLRRVPSLDKALLIATTGYCGEVYRARYHQAGFSVCLGKPLDLNALAALLGTSPAAVSA